MENVVSTEMAALSAQEKLLVSCYLKCMSKSQAAKEAGYATTSPFNKSTVKAAIAAQLETRASRLLVGGDWVLRQLVSVFERCNQVEKILDRDGQPTGEFKFDASNSLKALNLIGQHCDVAAFKSDAAPSDTAHAQGLIERLQRGRQRMNDLEKEVSFF
jgi:phage terminase small subunit